MPQARHALYAEGIDLHVCTWPGWSGLTEITPRSIAQEGRVYVIAICGLLSKADAPADFPMIDRLAADYPVLPFDGGSGIAGSDGAWVADRVFDTPTILIADVELGRVREQRLMFDPSGHYARPDVFETIVHRGRQRAVTFDDA